MEAHAIWRLHAETGAGMREGACAHALRRIAESVEARGTGAFLDNNPEL